MFVWRHGCGASPLDYVVTWLCTHFTAATCTRLVVGVLGKCQKAEYAHTAARAIATPMYRLTLSNPQLVRMPDSKANSLSWRGTPSPVPVAPVFMRACY